MMDLKKKCWREKVTAEITVAHLQRFAREMGSNMSVAEMAAFLNEKGRAQDVWTHMMQAAEDYIKASLPQTNVGLPTPPLTSQLHRNRQRMSHPGPVSYQ